MIPAGFDAIGVALVSWLLTYWIHSTILLSAAAAIAWRFPDHHEWLDLVWKAALIGPLVTASLQPGMAASPLGGRWSIADAPLVARSSGTAASALVVVEPTPIGDERTVPARTPSEPSAAVAPTTSTPHAGVVATASSVRWWPAFVALSWLGVAVIAVAAYLARLRTVYRTFAGAAPVSADVLERAPVIAVGVSDSCQVPLALAGRRIVVPSRLFDLDAEQQRAALAHEMAHVERRDPEWLIAIEVITRAFFFQPLHRVARTRVRDSAEFLCDQWAVRRTQSPLALAKCLSEVAAWTEGNRIPTE